MKTFERTRALVNVPRLFWDALLRGRYAFDYDQMAFCVQDMTLSKRWNLVRAGLNLLHRRLAPWALPLHVQVELTNYCNLQCPVCPVGVKAMTRAPQAMDVRLFEQVMDQLGPYLLTMSLWAWGEPLLHPRLGEILAIARRYPVATLLSTNGQRLNREENIQAIIENPPTHLIVALDGLEDATNSQFRVGAKVAPILEGVHRLAALKRERQAVLPILHMRYIVMKHNEHEVPRLQAFAREHGFDLLTTRTLLTVDAPQTAFLELMPAQPTMRAYEYRGANRQRRNGFLCHQPFWFPSVFVDGTVVACEQDHNAREPFGVMSDSVSFAEIWRSEHARRVRGLLRDHPSDYSFCRNCPFADHRATAGCTQAFVLNPGLPTRVPVPN